MPTVRAFVILHVTTGLHTFGRRLPCCRPHCFRGQSHSPPAGSHRAFVHRPYRASRRNERCHPIAYQQRLLPDHRTLLCRLRYPVGAKDGLACPLQIPRVSGASLAAASVGRRPRGGANWKLNLVAGLRSSLHYLWVHTRLAPCNGILAPQIWTPTVYPSLCP